MTIIQTAKIWFGLMVMMGASPIGFAIGYPYSFLLIYPFNNNASNPIFWGVIIGIIQFLFYIYILGHPRISLLKGISTICVIHLLAVLALFFIPYYKPIFKHPNDLSGSK